MRSTLSPPSAELSQRERTILASPFSTNKIYIQNVGSPPIFYPYPPGDITKMYLHIGNNKTVRESEITAVFDADTATMSPITKKFLKIAQAKNKLHTVTLDVPKSIIVMADGTVYLAQVASSTIVGRVN